MKNTGAIIVIDDDKAMLSSVKAMLQIAAEDFHNPETEKRAAELVIANQELAFQNAEQEKQAAELVIANEELIVQYDLKEERAVELAIANEELAFQNVEKEKRAAELVIANEELIYQRDLKEKRSVELAIANEAKSQFLANMSHDLRTPLNAIMGFSYMMMTKTFGPLGDDHYEEYARDIHDSASLLVSLINDVLDLSKIEAGKYELAKEHLDISSLIETSFKQLGHMAKTSSQALSFDVADDLPALLGDERAMTQILNNLLSNAIKFTPDGGAISVSVEADERNSIILTVTDSGMGMSEEGILKALKPFEQANSTRSHEHQGTGLGLHLCNNFMKLFGGTLEIESDVGKSTSITLKFPPERTIPRTEVAVSPL